MSAPAAIPHRRRPAEQPRRLILDDGKPIRDVHSALAVIRRNAELQARLIDDLLDMNRLLSDNVSLQVGPCDVATLLQTTMQALQRSGWR